MMEQFKCPSFYDDDRVLQNCQCGKCGVPASPNVRTILERIVPVLHDGKPKLLTESVKAAEGAIQSLVPDFYLSCFHYEDWDCGDDDALRAGDRINLNHQRPHDGYETNMTGSIVQHYVSNVPVVELDEEWGSEYADLQSLMMDGWTFARLEPKVGR